MAEAGGCHCGAVRYEVSGEPQHSSICHCTDCRKSSGAPFVAWSAFPSDRFRVTAGEAKAFHSSGTAYRHFCELCGSGLYYVNEQVLPGLVDIQVATLDNPEALPPMLHVQTAERLDWVSGLNDLPQFERYPG